MTKSTIVYDDFFMGYPSLDWSRPDVATSSVSILRCSRLAAEAYMDTVIREWQG